jgi:hypothetical protein
LFNERRQMQLIPFLLNKRNIGEHVLAYFMLTQGFWAPKKLEFVTNFTFFTTFLSIINNHKIYKITKCIIGKLTKKPFKWVYICWTKSEQEPRYLLPKLTLPQPKQVRSSSKVLTLKAGTKKVAGNKEFHVVVFS